MDDVHSGLPTPAASLRAALVALVVAFATYAVAAALAANDPRFQDTEPFLGHALYVADLGGPLHALGAAFRGEFAIVERHLLYPLLLAPFAARDPQFFLTAKLLNVALGAAALLSLWWIARRRGGARVALLAAGLYATSSALIVASSHVAQENLFVLCALWAWHWLAGAKHDAVPPPVRWAAGGALLGLAWLTKSSAALLGLALALAAVAHWGPRVAIERRTWALVACGALVASPLVVRNVIAFGTPVYEGVNGHIMWMDAWSELGDPRSVLHYDQYGILRLERNALPTAATYRERHSLPAAVERMTRGLVDQVGRVAPTAVAPPLRSPRLVRAWGLLVLALAAAAAWRGRRQWCTRLVVAWSAAFVAFFAWNTLFPEPRYFAPLVPLWAMLAAHTLDRALGLRVHPAWRDGLVAAAIAALGVLATARAAYDGTLSRPPPAIAASPAAWRLLHWIDTEAIAGSRLVIGPTREFFGLLWLATKPVQIVQTPTVEGLPEFLRYLRERDVRYLVLHPENAGGQQQRLAAALAPYVTRVASGIVELDPLPGWQRVAADVALPPRYLVYEAVPAMPARHAAAWPPR